MPEGAVCHSDPPTLDYYSKDPRIEYDANAQDDTGYWAEVLSVAGQLCRGMQKVLHGFRNEGSRLLVDERKENFRMVPIISGNPKVSGWSSYDDWKMAIQKFIHPRIDVVMAIFSRAYQQVSEFVSPKPEHYLLDPRDGWDPSAQEDSALWVDVLQRASKHCVETQKLLYSFRLSGAKLVLDEKSIKMIPVFSHDKEVSDWPDKEAWIADREKWLLPIRKNIEALFHVR